LKNYLTLIQTIIGKVEVRELQRIKQVNFKKYVVAIRNNINMKHIYVTGIVFFQLLALVSIFKNIYYVVTYICLYTILSIVLIVYLYRKEMKVPSETTLNNRNEYFQ
jgi:hypothetical protein